MQTISKKEEEQAKFAYENASSKRVRGATVGEGIESNFSGGVLSLAECGAIVGALEDLAVEVNGSLKSRGVVRAFPYAGVRGKVEAAPLGQLLQLVLVHLGLSISLSC